MSSSGHAWGQAMTAQGEANARHQLPSRVASSCIDRLMWTTYLDDRVGGQAPILVHFRGQVDEERMERAFDLTVEAEPILGYALVGHPSRPYWQRVEERDRGPVFEAYQGEDADRELLEFMASPLLTERSPQLQARLFRSQDDVLCIKFNHILMDGGGAGQYLALLSSCYRALERDPDHHPQVRMPDRRGHRRALREAGLLSALRSFPSLRAPPPTLAVPMKRDDRSRQTFVVRHLGPERLSTLRSYARRNGATINDVLFAAMVRSALTTLQAPPGRPFGFEVPVDLRRVAPCGAAGICNLSGMYYLSVDHRPDESFESTLSRVHGQIEEQKAARTTLGEMLLLDMALGPGASLVRWWMERTPDRAFHPYLSNLGVVDSAAVDFGPVTVGDVRYFSTIIHPPVLGIAVSTLGQRMTLTHRYYSLATEPTLMEGFLDRFVGELPGGASNETEGPMSACDAGCRVEWPTSLAR